MPCRETESGSRIAQPVLDDADVVRREIPERINVRADAAQVQALAVNVANFAKFAGINQFFDVAHGGSCK